MAFTLRPYQSEAVAALWQALRDGIPTPLACLPTGAGKTAVVAELCRHAVREWGAKVLVLCHVKELVEQLSQGIRAHWPDAFCPVGVVSAGLGQRSIDQITVAGIQSVYRRAVDLGPRNLIIIDEAHCIPPDGDGMYRSLMDDLRVINPKARTVGLTATPYRLTSGLIVGDGAPFCEMVYDAGVKNLIDAGYLSPLRGKNGGDPDLSGVHRRGGEFIAAELEASMADEEKVRLAVQEMLKHGADRKAWLVFCCGVKHAQMVAQRITDAGIEAQVVTGDTPTDLRDEYIARYKAGDLRCLVNVNVLTTGFDAPHVDLVVMLRPTESPGLYYQICGRGLRKSPGKTDCMILDLAGNIARHGPIDQLNDRVAMVASAKKAGQKEPGPPPMKTCPQCAEEILAAVGMCPCCGHEFPREQAKHGTRASDLAPVSEPVKPEWYSVSTCDYEAWTKKGTQEGEAPQTLRVTYWGRIERIASEWVCVEHSGFALEKATIWVSERLAPGWNIDGGHDKMAVVSPGGEVFIGAKGLAAASRFGCFICPTEIELTPDGRYERVTAARINKQEREPGADEDQPAPVGVYSIDDEPPF
jgi:DNA repair protein RadD